MIEQLANRHNEWVCMAKKICRDSELANDLVQEMYLKLLNHKCEINEGYIYLTIKNIFIDQKRKTKEYPSELSPNIPYKEDTDLDELQHDNNNFILTKETFKELKWYEKEILKLSTTEGVLELSRSSGISKFTIQKIRKQFKEKVLCRKEEIKNRKDWETLSKISLNLLESNHVPDVKSVRIF